jgi:hypothetical protein
MSRFRISNSILEGARASQSSSPVEVGNFPCCYAPQNRCWGRGPSCDSWKPGVTFGGIRRISSSIARAITPLLFMLYPRSGYNRTSYSLKIPQIKYTFVHLIQLAWIFRKRIITFPKSVPTFNNPLGPPWVQLHLKKFQASLSDMISKTSKRNKN